jgi:hypothetical protein
MAVEACAARSLQGKLGSNLQPDSFHLTQRNFVFGPIVELGCSWRLIGGHLLSMLELSVVLQVNRNCPL